jgi:putative ABC transport system permease protein
VARPLVADAIFGKGGPVDVRVVSLLDELTGRVRPALRVLAAAVFVLLLICCANVANLLLARGVARRRELAVRSAVGASRGRLLRQLATEGLVTTALGGALGLALAAVLLRALPALAPADFPRLADVRLDTPTLGFALLATLLAGVLSGTLPALRSAGGELLPALRDGVGASAGRHALRFGRALLVAQAALAVMLLVGAGLLLRSFDRLIRVDAGYDPAGVLLARVYLPEATSSERIAGFAEALLPRLRGLPGVVAAGAGNMAPLMPNTMLASSTWPEPGPRGERITARAVLFVVTPGFAEALALRLREGRLLTEADAASGVRSLLVNEEFARSYMADGRPVVGRRYEGVFGPANVTSEIVGVVANVLKDGLDTRPQPEVFVLPRLGQSLPGELNLALRSTAGWAGVSSALRAAAAELEPSAAVELTPLASRLSASVAQPRFAAATLTSLALLALSLAALGLYGVLSYSVSQRRREMGVRAALGAGRADIVRLVMLQGLGVTAAGLLLGIAGAGLLTRVLEQLLFGVSPLDGAAFAAGSALLLAVAAAASFVPAWRAAKVNPSEALRCE